MQQAKLLQVTRTVELLADLDKLSLIVRSEPAVLLHPQINSDRLRSTQLRSVAELTLSQLRLFIFQNSAIR